METYPEVVHQMQERMPEIIAEVQSTSFPDFHR